MSQQLAQLEQKQTLKVNQLLRQAIGRYTQITRRFSDGQNGRCASGAIASILGWNGRGPWEGPDKERVKPQLLEQYDKLREHYGISITHFNDMGYSWEKIAQMFEKIGL